MKKETTIKQTHSKEVALEVQGYTKVYRGGKKAVDNLSFSVKKGQFHGFIGENGAGKTTTIKAIIAAYKKYQGNIEIFGINSKKEESRKKIGYIPEYAKFPPAFTTIAYLIAMGQLSGMSKKDASTRANELIKELDIEDLAKRKPNDFSSGQKKKILLAQAIIHDPDIIIMDEPAANLDPSARIEFFSILKDMQKKGKAIFISSHILTELDKYVDSVTLLSKGKLVFSGTVEELRNTSKNKGYEMRSQNRDGLEKIIKSSGLKYKDEGGTFVIDYKSEKDVISLQKSVADAGMLLDHASFTGSNLEDIYKEKVMSEVHV